jgi:hypothetical protein
MRSAVIKERRSISLSHSSCDMFAGFSFGATVRGFDGAFVGAFLFSAMAATRVFRVGGWMEEGVPGGRNERRRGRCFDREDV